jgi:hypothetical protein
MVRSQAVAELTNYRGISDWGEVKYIDTWGIVIVDMADQTMQSYVSAYATGLGTLSIAGAGLVYSTIFRYVRISSLIS